MAPAISPTKDAVGFVEVVGERSSARDRVWIYRRNDRSVRMIDDDTVRPKSAGSGLVWSPDSRHVLINFGSGVTVIDVTRTLPSVKFRGADACWSGTRTIVVGGTTGLDTIDVITGGRQSLVAGAARPQCLDVPPK
jgi:hypothetical protein